MLKHLRFGRVLIEYTIGTKCYYSSVFRKYIEIRSRHCVLGIWTVQKI
jgi:hypothetical protein